MRCGSRCAPRWRTSAQAGGRAPRGSQPSVPDAGLLAAMPAYLPNGGGLAAKLVSLFPGNAGSRLPTHQAVVLVFDPESGEPLALLDGTSITTRRTAAGSALSAELLAREDAETLAILGTGVQARGARRGDGPGASGATRARRGTQPRARGCAVLGPRGLARAGGSAGRQLRRGLCGRGHRLRRDPCHRTRGPARAPPAGGARDLGGLQHRGSRGRLGDRGGRTGGRRVPRRRARGAAGGLQRPAPAHGGRAHRSRARPRRDRRAAAGHEAGAYRRRTRSRCTSPSASPPRTSRPRTSS